MEVNAISIDATTSKALCHSGIGPLRKPTIAIERQKSAAEPLINAMTNPPRCASKIKRFAPTVVAEKRKGTRKAGKEYFQDCIMAPKGLPPVTAAAAEGESPTGGETSERTAK